MAKGTISQEGEDYSRPRDMSEILGGGQDGYVFVDDSTPLVRPVFSCLFKRLCIVTCFLGRAARLAHLVGW